jgi:hypothetical protein
MRRIRVRIKVKSRIRISIKVKSWNRIRIHIEVMQICNTANNIEVQPRGVGRQEGKGFCFVCDPPTSHQQENWWPA